QSSPLKLRYFIPTWKLLMLYIVKCLGGNQGSHDQLNNNQQVIAYALCWGMNIDIAEILFTDLTLKDYINEDLRPIKAHQITRATFKDSKISKVPLISYMRKVAKLSDEPLTRASIASDEDTGDKSLFRTVVHLVSEPKVKTNKKRRKKKSPSSSKPKASETVKEINPTPPASEYQEAKEIKVPADNTKSLDASKSAEEQENKPQTVVPKKGRRMAILPYIKFTIDGAKDDDHELTSIGHATFEELNEPVEESSYDTESEIKIIKRFRPLINDKEPELSATEEDSRLASIPDDEVRSLFGSETSAADDNNTELNASADKPSLSDPLGHLQSDISNLNMKVDQLESSVSKLITKKLEETVPDLVAETIKATFPELISESLKTKMPPRISESVQEILKPINKKFKTFNKLEASCFVMLQKSVTKDLKKKLGLKIKKETMLDRFESASVFEKANVEREKIDKPLVSDKHTQFPDPTQGEHLKKSDELSNASILQKNKEADDETPSKRLKFKVPKEILSPTPLRTLIPQQINLGLFLDTSAGKSSDPPRDERKRKGIAKYPLKTMVSYMEDEGSALRIPTILELKLTEEETIEQLKEYKRLADLKAKKEKFEESLKKLMNPANIKAQAISEYKQKKAKMLEEYNHYINSRADQRQITKIIYTIDKVTRDATMRIKRDNQPLSLTQAGKLGFPSLYELTAFGLTPAEKKRKRTSEMIEEVFKKENISVDGMHRNLIPPEGVVGSRWLVITEPEAVIFFYNGNFDLAFQRKLEFHLATTSQLIRTQQAIQRNTPKAEEMYKKLEFTIEARDDAAVAKKILKDNLDDMGM
nr:hypothetical protein [Tanacetum cinerariifolium]